MADDSSGQLGRTFEALSRREFVGTVGTGLSAGAMVSLAGCQDLERTDDEGNPPLRQCLSSLQQSDPNDILETFAEGVEAMQELDDDDPRQWDNVVDIHLFGEHWNWYFLPWHRAYLLYFEDIIRELTGNANFALPYWNWIDNPELPEVFGEDWNVDGDDVNPLYHANRTIDVGDDARDEDVVSESMIESIVDNEDFFDFAGTQTAPGDLEFHPHNHVHGGVGGDMNNVSISPVDPVFWTHHCMVDYLWWDWNANRQHPVPNDDEDDASSDDALDWISRTFDGQFVDASGEDVDQVSVLETLLMPTRSFEYADCPGDSLLVPLSEDLIEFIQTGAVIEREILEQVPITDGFEVDPTEAAVVTADLAIEELRPYLTGEEPARVKLGMRDVTPPERGEFVTLVFLNRPEIAEEPAGRDPHYARNLDFFVGGDHAHEFDLSIDLTDTLTTLLEGGHVDDGEPLELQFVSFPYVEGGLEDSFAVGELSIDVIQTTIDGDVIDRSRLE